MPELPDVEGFRRAAADAVGRTVTSIERRDSWACRRLDPAELKPFRGRRLRGARRHGKHLFLLFDQGPTLALHFGMGGRLLLERDAGAPPAHTALVLRLEGGGRLVYVNERLGSVAVAEDPASFLRRQRLGPDALGVTEHEFADAVAARRGSIKAALMDQHVLAGIGNVYSDEILFQARVGPRERGDRLASERLRDLYHALREVLARAALVDGEAERLPPSFLTRRRRLGAACPRCGTSLRTASFASRTAYFCGTCQPDAAGGDGKRRRSTKKRSGLSRTANAARLRP